MKFFKKNKLLIPILIVTAIGSVSLWLGLGYPRPIVQGTVLVEAGDSTAHGEIVIQKLSENLRLYPFSAKFKVTTDGGFGGRHYGSVLIYNRLNKTVDESNWSTDEGSGRRDQHYLYSGVTDNTIHSMATAGKFWPDFVDDGAVPTRKVLSEKFTKY